MSASEIALRESFTFVSRWLSPGARVLEIGCGSGALAAALGAAGHRVLAIDADAERVAEAAARGVDARVAEFPKLDGIADAAFDALLFTHSLHHVHALDAAVGRTRELLRPGGTLVIEDFTWDELPAETARWAYAHFDAQREKLRLGPRAWRHEGDPLATWRKHFLEHELHGAAALRAAVAAHFEIVSSEPVPYFFRYACMSLGDAPDGRELAGAFLRDERARVARGEIAALGWQLVAR
ncbi:MAG TPA: methyltransferase domain-containing protein [Myxococcota bacterium]|nr:methyltransferase domain-containing protein [Myxococcota bacterium]